MIDDHIEITATYSVEDNKLRLYASERLDSDLYQRVRDAGFKWAPKQELFVAPAWTPEREDFCIDLAGEITAEQTTLIERAEAKAERLDSLACKRHNESNSFHSAASRISERFEFGQPILVGHHSERKARKDQKQMQSAMDNAIRAKEAANYWQYRAKGVERHANCKSAPGVRARRIKTLLAELRSKQRDINHAHICLDLWRKIEKKKDKPDFKKTVTYWAGAHLKSGPLAPEYLRADSLWSRLEKNEIEPLEAVQICINFHELCSNNPNKLRWINHILNRLGFERSELGAVARFDGNLTPVILQGFCRTHGADKPKAAKTETGYKVESPAPLPLHIAEGKEVDLSNDQWRDLMQASGYEVEIKAKKAPKKQSCPLINPTPEEAAKLQAKWNAAAKERKYGSSSERLEVEQAHYSANSKGSYSSYETIELDENGYRIWKSWQCRVPPTPACRVRIASGGELYSADRVITITDKPQKPLPVNLEPEAEKEKAA